MSIIILCCWKTSSTFFSHQDAKTPLKIRLQKKRGLCEYLTWQPTVESIQDLSLRLIISHWLKVLNCQSISYILTSKKNSYVLSFYRFQNVLCWSKFFELVQNFWLQKFLCRHKNQFYWMRIIFLSGTKCMWLAQYINKFCSDTKNLDQHKTFCDL